VQPYYTGMLARAAGMDVTMSLTDDVLTIIAEKPTA
jgi:hypothetical protein